MRAEGSTTIEQRLRHDRMAREFTLRELRAQIARLQSKGMRGQPNRDARRRAWKEGRRR